jgi:hypothetical protein
MSPDELDAIRERDGSDQHYSRARLSEGAVDRHALLTLVDELLKREQRVIGLLDSWAKDEQVCRQEDAFGEADTLNDCRDDLRKALWP